MNELETENGENVNGVTWSVRQSTDCNIEPSDRLVVFELQDPRGTVLASVSVPAQTIIELLSPHLSIFAELQLDGTVSLDSELFALFPPSKTTDIFELVKDGIAPEMLCDEPNLKEQLNELRRKLMASLTLVDQALANLDKPVA